MYNIASDGDHLGTNILLQGYIFLGTPLKKERHMLQWVRQTVPSSAWWNKNTFVERIFFPPPSFSMCFTFSMTCIISPPLCYFSDNKVVHYSLTAHSRSGLNASVNSGDVTWLQLDLCRSCGWWLSWSGHEIWPWISPSIHSPRGSECSLSLLGGRLTFSTARSTEVCAARDEDVLGYSLAVQIGVVFAQWPC